MTTKELRVTTRHRGTPGQTRERPRAKQTRHRCVPRWFRAQSQGAPQNSQYSTHSPVTPSFLATAAASRQ